MSRLHPVVRATAVALVASALAGAAAGWMHLEALREAARTAARDALAEHVVLAASALAPAATDRDSLVAALGPYARASAAASEATRARPPLTWAIVSADGRLVATSDPQATRGVPWATVLSPSPASRAASDARPPDPEGTPRAVVRGGDETDVVWVAVRTVSASGDRVAALRPAPSVPAASAAATWTAFGALWAMLSLVLVALGWWAGPSAHARLARTVGRLARPETADPVAAVAAGGAPSAVLAPVAERLGALAAAVAGAREHIGALYQVNPHYVVLVTMDGRIVEANPAFYAVTGLAPDALRGASVDALDDAFPLAPLMEMAERSLAEGASIGGLEYAVADAEGNGRPVEVSLRAFHQGATPVVLVQATDVAVRRTLERRVAAFSDTLDLMVDQRVQQLAAGQQSLRRLLDAAGVAVASFDAGGGTRRWSGAMQVLSGRPAADVPHFHTAVTALGLPPEARDAFGRWFWSLADEPFVAVHGAASGRPRAMLWRKVAADRAGSADHRTLVGVDLPDASVAAYLAHEALHAATGDGAAGAPQPARS